MKPDAVAPDRRALALKMAAVHGDGAVFEAMAEAFRTSRDTVLRGQLLTALGRFVDPVLAVQARALALEPDTRANEVAVVLGVQTREPELRDPARRWLREHYQALLDKGPSGFGGTLVRLDAEGRCDPLEAAEIEAWHGPRLREVEGGPRRLAQAAETVRLCAALRVAQAGPIRAPAATEAI